MLLNFYGVGTHWVFCSGFEACCNICLQIRCNLSLWACKNGEYCFKIVIQRNTICLYQTFVDNNKIYSWSRTILHIHKNCQCNYFVFWFCILFECEGELCHWATVSVNPWELGMPRVASVFCLHLIGRSSFYVIVPYAIVCLLSLCLSLKNFIVFCDLGVFLPLLESEVLEVQKTEFGKAFLILLHNLKTSYKKKIYFFILYF